MSKRLPTCPWCEAPIIVRVDADKDTWQIRCTDCGARGPLTKSAKECYDKWDAVANAALMVAAPDLLREAERVIAALAGSGFPQITGDLQSVVNQARGL